MAAMADSPLIFPRTEGLIGAGLTSKRLPKLEPCGTVKCPNKMAVVLGPEAYRDERTLQRALSENTEAPGWRVFPAEVRRTLQKPLKVWVVLCPQCSAEMDRAAPGTVTTLNRGLNVKL